MSSTPTSTTNTSPHIFSTYLPTSPSLLLAHNTSLLSLYPDLRAFITAHAELEKEYGTKLGALVKKMERTLGVGNSGGSGSGGSGAGGGSDGRRVRELCVGVDANGNRNRKEWREGDEKRNTLLSALTTHLSLLTTISQTHLTHSTSLQTQILSPLRSSEQTKRAILRASATWIDSERSEREKIYEGRKRKRGVYWDCCREVNGVRGRIEKERNGGGGGGLASFLPSSSSASSSSPSSTATQSHPHSLARSPSTTNSSDKLHKFHHQALLDAHNSKNDYLLSIKVACEERRRWEGVGGDGWRVGVEMENIHNSTINRLTTLLSHTATLSSSTYETLQLHSQRISDAYARVDPGVDAEFFVEYSIPVTRSRSNTTNEDLNDDDRAGDGQAEKDGIGAWGWEPAPGYYEEEEINLEGNEEKVYLQNKLARAKLERGRLAHSIKEKDKEIDGARRLAQTYEANRGMGDPDEVIETLLLSLKDVTVMGIQEEAYEHEIATLEAVLGDDQGGQLPHDFKAGTFAVPTTCDYCQGSIWGLTKPGETCRACGMNAHVKCSQKLPADCGGSNSLERKRTSSRKERPPSMIGFTSPPASPSLANEASSPDRMRPSLSEGSTTSPSSRLSMHGLRKSFTRHRSSEPGASSVSSISSIAGLGIPVDEILPDHSRYPDFIAPPGMHTGPHLPGSSYTVSAPSSNGHDTSPTILEEPEERENPFEQGLGEEEVGQTTQSATVIWDFRGSDPDEITVDAGREVQVLEPDDGSGWMKVRLGTEIGLIPSQYVKLVVSTPPAQQHPRHPERQQTLMPAQLIALPQPAAVTLHRVEAMYDYAATEQDETSILTGKTYVLTLRTAPTEEWWEVIGEGDRRGLVPANYVRPV